MALVNNSAKDKYVSILADGTLRLVVPEGTEGAVKREYETSTGAVGSKFELVFTEVSGLISKVNFFDGDFGKLIQLTISDEAEDPLVLSVSTASNFGEDLMKKLPNVDLTKPVRIVPYAFDDDKGKKKKGVTIYQDDEKVKSFYHDAEGKGVLNGYPVAPKKKVMSSDDWKLYFLNARMFLIDDITERFKIESTGESADEQFEKLGKATEEEKVPFE